MSETLPPAEDDAAWHHDYLVDMIGQLARQADEIGEREVAVLLAAVARARRTRIDEGRLEEDRRSPLESKATDAGSLREPI